MTENASKTIKRGSRRAYITENYQDFDLSFLFDTDKSRKTTRVFMQDAYERVQAIRDYSNYSYLRKEAAFKRAIKHS